nr:hypothetical protein BaRGS_033272 [Batillaria attramentaria]
MAPRFPNSTVYRERPSPAASPEARFQSYPFARNYASSNNASVVACSPGEPSKHDRVEFHEEEDEEDSVPYLKHSARLKKYRSVKLGVKGMAMETAGRHDTKDPSASADEGKRAKCLGELLSEVERTSTQSGRLEALFDHGDDTLDRRNRSSDSDLINRSRPSSRSSSESHESFDKDSLELDSTSYERRDKAEKSWDSGRELDWNESSCRRPRELPEAILGEIAFQLERRVLREVFDKRRRSSGGSSSTSCSQQKKSPKGGQRHRFYGVNKHGLLAQNIINKYGLFYQPPDAATIVRLGLHDFRTVRDHVIRMTSGKEREGMLVLLNCLHALGSKENQPILSFD